MAQARRRARDMLDRIRAGGNLADDIQREKKAPTFRTFAAEYLRRSDPHWKRSGRRTVRIYLNARILSAFGRMALDAACGRIAGASASEPVLRPAFLPGGAADPLPLSDASPGDTVMHQARSVASGRLRVATSQTA